MRYQGLLYGRFDVESESGSPGFEMEGRKKMDSDEDKRRIRDALQAF